MVHESSGLMANLRTYTGDSFLTTQAAFAPPGNIRSVIPAKCASWQARCLQAVNVLARQVLPHVQHVQLERAGVPRPSTALGFSQS